MPAPVTSSSSARTANKTVTLKPRSQAQVKKTRIVRRRGRANDGIGSDDEIEREVATDSESEDDLSSLESDSDSDTEPPSEDVVLNGHSHAFTPSTSQSPGDRGTVAKDSASHSIPAPFFTPAGNWSEMVTDENTNGPAELPVIEFADFDGQDVPPSGPRSRKTKKHIKSARPAPETQSLPLQEDIGTEPEQVEPIASSSRRSPSPSSFRRPAGQTARQAYQQRLDSDPSYVPTVGGFWGHDDRLLDKDLRSLSGWWRGRWQGRGRGGGFVRGRGRGGYFLPLASSPSQDVDGQNGEPESTETVPPIDRAWTHDGFEEMKRREEQRRAATQQAQPQRQTSQATRGTNTFRGNRGFAPGREGRGGYTGGGFVASPTRSRVNSPFSNRRRVWYAMKPELMWTKQHEAFLHFDPALKPRQGQGPGFRVKVPGADKAQIVRGPLKPYSFSNVPNVTPTTNDIDPDLEGRAYAVRLPKRVGKGKQVEVPSVETSIEEVFTVRPQLVESKPIPLPVSAPAINGTASYPSHHAPPHQPGSSLSTGPPSRSQSESSIKSQLEQFSPNPQISDPARRAKTEEAVLKNPLPETPAVSQQPDLLEGDHRPPLPALQTVFTPPPPPVSQPSPAYGSPYPYAPPLPPGIAMNQHGMPYELATGRPVYLQPPPMYNPRPIMHSHMAPPGMPFVPGHMHHHSVVSPDFVAHSNSHTPPMNGFIDPATGTPIFSFPRQTSRIEIRAPSEGSEVKSPPKSSANRSSGLRTTAPTFEPSRSADRGYYPSTTAGPVETGSLPLYMPMDGGEGSGPGDDGHGSPQHLVDPTMLTYPHYQQPQYYYPEAYGYPQYMDMTQAQYEMYPADTLPPQGTVYY